MTILIPAIGACTSRMTSGERRFAHRLEDKLEDDYLCWYDVSIGERTQRPDFVIFHPGRGLLVLEVKDWKTTTLQSMTMQHSVLLTDRGIVHELNPLEQARQYLYAVIHKLERDPMLVWPSGSLKGKPFFPYGHGVVLSNISRQQFDHAQLNEVIPPHLVICQDEMTERVDVEQFQQRLWSMFPIKFRHPLSIPQIDRIRWHLFPEIRITAQAGLFDQSGQTPLELPDLLRVMDLQQEQLARSLGEGHRIIHGVAGSGKTLILGYRAERLAQVCQRPILILCYNKTLATKLREVMAAKGVQDKVHVVNFHAWCVRQLDTYHAGKPPLGGNRTEFFDACVDRVIRSVDQQLIPTGQYDAVLIDEGHDFKSEWLKLIVQMVHPDSNSLLVLYDDAQSIYGGPAKKRFSFSSVGIQAQGRTTILKMNYRNTTEILGVARAFADELLTSKETEEDQAPTVQPMSAGRHGPPPLLIKLPSLQAEAKFLATKLVEANRTGMPWNEMGVLYRSISIGKLIADELTRKQIPFQMQQDKKLSFAPEHDSVKLITMHSSKGLEFSLVGIPAVGAAPDDVDSLQDEARLLYVAMTRATQQLVMTHGPQSVLIDKMERAMGVLQN